MKRFFFLLLPLFACLSAAAADNTQSGIDRQDGFEIKVRIKNYPDSLGHLLYLGYYNWSAQYISDTAVYNPKTHTYLFKGDKAKDGGMYMLITEDRQYVDFIFDRHQHIEIDVTYPDMFSSISFKNSPENDIYQAFAEVGKTDFKTVNQLQSEYQQAETAADETRKEALREQISSVYKKIEQDRIDFALSNPENLMAAIFNAQREPEIPEAPESIPDSLKRSWQYEYYKNHYFDNFDLCDERLLRTPLLHQRIKSFHEKVLYMQSPDSIKYAWERVIEKARCADSHSEVFKFLVWYPVDAYQRSEIIGQDAIWVYLAKKYYLSGDAFWASASIVENFRKRIERVEPLLIGNRPAEFYCPDTTIESAHPNWVSVFSSPKRYSVVIFWSTTCGHCKTAMPLWHKLYMEEKDRLDFEVFAICKDFDVPVWKKYIREHNLEGWYNLNGKESNLDYNDAWDIVTTPTVYVLDREKRIVTKKIDPQYLKDFILNWQETHYPHESPLE